MDECGHYSIRGDVAKHREREPRMNYPFTLPQGLTDEQIRACLLPLMASRKCKRWDCQLCIKEFMEQDCPHDHQQLAIEAGPFVAAPNLDVAQTNLLIVEQIDAVEVLISTEGSENAEDECITKKQQPEAKVFFDLNIPIVEPCDEALENSNNHAPAAEALVVADNPELSIADLVSVDEQQTRNLEALESEASAQLPNNGIGNSDVSPLPETLVQGGNKISSIKKARKYHSISYLNDDRRREGSRNVTNSNPQYKKPELKNKKKMHQSRTVQEGPAGANICEAAADVSGQNRKNRTADCNLPLKQNFTLADVSATSRRESSGKIKHPASNDQNGNSDAIVSNSSEEGLQNESRSVDLQLRKRRIFCNVKKTPLADAEHSQSVEPDGDPSQRIEPDVDQSQRLEPAADQSQGVELVCHKSKENAPSSSERNESLTIPVADLGNSRPTRIKKATSEAAYQLMLGRKRKNKNRGIALDKESPEKSSPLVVEKELVSQDTHILTIAKDVPMPCLQDDNFNLKQLKTEIIKALKRHKFDSPSADRNQNVIRTGGNGTSSPVQSEKSSLKEVKRRGRPKKVPMSGTSGSGTKKKQGNEQPLRPIYSSEAALQLLSTVAVDTLENEALADSGPDRTFLPIMEEFHVPPIRNVLEMGYEGCIEVTNPADYFLAGGEWGDRFKLGPEDLPLMPHRLLPAKGVLHVSASPTIAAARVAVPAE